MSNNIALIAHDNKKNDLVSFVKQHREFFSRYHLIATGTTGQRIEQDTKLEVEKMASGALGGDVQISAKIVESDIAAVIFLIDPLYAQPHEPDIKALLRICEVYNVPLATNLSTAKAIVKSLSQSRVGHLIFNPVAGQGNPEQELDRIKKILSKEIYLKITFTRPDVSVTQQTKEIIEKIQQEKEMDDHFVIASGGDGTVSEVAAALINTGIPLGIIPRGTANAFCGAIGIPSDIQGACHTICQGVTRIVDTAICNDIPMLLLAGVGFEAETVAKADRDMKNRLGVMAYIFAGIQQAKEQKLFNAEIEINSEVNTIEASAITIANAAPPTSVLAQGAGEVDYNDGLLDITIASSQSTLQGIGVITSLFTSGLVKNPSNHDHVAHFQAESIKVKTEPEQRVVVDGEIIGNTPIEVRCIPNSLSLFVPIENQ
ncbi:methylglyoxal synthase [Cyanobacterium stanieri LEGE 03274]|uniref:Methylglyoxal synthase n=1 Tax=Cyanobacterium stanieri LEGE 03274 TaxID=1828756 RepID=A0ABR9V4P3_9CHRO|nr:methylglyoxal synthase [Cyanobacterium stanieri]MBE9222869.1 methylglyoxal synthase [Cyanobacterium stanieri LEGE 03274]